MLLRLNQSTSVYKNDMTRDAGGLGGKHACQAISSLKDILHMC